MSEAENRENLLWVDAPGGAYPIYWEPDFAGLAAAFAAVGLGGRKLFLVTDSNVEPLYAQAVARALEEVGPVACTAFPAGEGSKHLATIQSFYDFLLEHKADRKSVVVALGGGVTGDMAGFVAATFLRSLPFVQIPTTLLAQVDSSVGGKVGVDFRGVKNLIGAFYQPRLVYMAQSTLSTLPRREYGAGMAEVLKTALIWDEGFWDFLRQNRAALLARDEEALREAQRRCCAAKAAVVARDERESGLREILNFGHTVGHAVESCLGFRLLHGECVGLGMLCALRLSGLPTDTLRDELRAYGLPERVEGLTKEEIYEQMFLDKKVRDGKLRFVLLSRVGKAYSTDEVSRAALFDALEEIV